MPSKVKLLRINTPGASPTTAQIDLGELCVHVADGKIFFKKLNGETEDILVLEPNSQVSIGSLGDVDVTTVTPTAGQTLVYNSTTEQFEPGDVSTNLSYTSSTRVLASSTGTNVTLPEVSAGGDSGLMTGADKTKLDGLQSGQGSTNLSYTASTRVIASSSGTDATLPEVSAGGDSGLMTGADKTKLDGIDAGAEVNTVTSVNSATGAVVLDADDIDDTSTINKFVTSADITALSTLESDLSGKADLSGGKLDTSQLPDIAITEFKGSVASQAAMLAVSGEKGDWVVRSDDGKVYVITGTDPSVIGSWTALSYPVASGTDLSYTGSTRVLASSTGTNATLPNVVAGGNSGLMTGADKTKLNGIETGATADQTKADIDALNINADQLDGQHGSYYQNASNLNAGTIPHERIADIGDSEARTITFDNLEKSDLTVDGDLGFDSSQGLILYRTQQGVSGSAVTVLDGANVQAGDHINISNLGGGATDTGRITFSVNDGAGSGLNADQVDGLHASQFLRSDANDSTTGTITAPKIDTPEIENSGGITIDANGSGADITLSAADHVILTSGVEEDGNIYFRGNGGADSYRFAKSGQTAIEGFLSFQSLTADRTYTFPNSGGTIALTTSNVSSATTATNCSRSISGGNGLTGGGQLTANRTLNVGAGTGISVGNDAVSVDSTVVRTTGNKTLSGNITFSGTVTTNGVLNIRGNADLADNDILRFGSGDDCELFCNGSHMYMDLNGGIGNFYIRDGTTTRFTFNDNGSFTATGTISGTFNTTNVRTAIAAGTAGQVGTYALLVIYSNSSNRSPNYTVGSSNLYYSNSGANAGTNKPSGSWRLMGRIASASGDQQEDESSVWLRYA